MGQTNVKIQITKIKLTKRPNELLHVQPRVSVAGKWNGDRETLTG